MAQWDPKTYLAFADERTRPARELLSRVPNDAPGRVVDLGCGPGNSTELLKRRWPSADVEGVDSSPEMIAQARSTSIDATWILQDIATWTPKTAYDVILSNATLHWVDDLNHLLPRLMESVAPGGVLAFQLPLNFKMPSHALIREVADDGPWAEKLRHVRSSVTLYQPEIYYEILEPYAKSLDIWDTEYLQVLEGPDPVYHWISGTGLRPFVQALDDDEREAFIAAYRTRLAEAYPRRASGTTLFPFRRLFVVAHR